MILNCRHVNESASGRNSGHCPAGINRPHDEGMSRIRHIFLAKTAQLAKKLASERALILGDSHAMNGEGAEVY